MGKVIITGAGRAGTTFLVRLLTRLGFDTGFTPGAEPFCKEWRSGSEWQAYVDYNDISFDQIRQTLDASPHIMKAPEWSFWLKPLLARGLLELDHLIMPIRDLDVAAHSRLAVGLDWKMPDGLTDDERPDVQAHVHAAAVGRVVEAAMLYSIPLTIMAFPSFVRDMGYCYDKLSNVVDIDWLPFETAWGGLAQPEMIKWA
jgi:hypothetical protein